MGKLHTDVIGENDNANQSIQGQIHLSIAQKQKIMTVSVMKMMMIWPSEKVTLPYLK